MPLGVQICFVSCHLFGLDAQGGTFVGAGQELAEGELINLPEIVEIAGVEVEPLLLPEHVDALPSQILPLAVDSLLFLPVQIVDLGRLMELLKLLVGHGFEIAQVELGAYGLHGVHPLRQRLLAGLLFLVLVVVQKHL